MLEGFELEEKLNHEKTQEFDVLFIMIFKLDFDFEKIEHSIEHFNKLEKNFLFHFQFLHRFIIEEIKIIDFLHPSLFEYEFILIRA